ncbi:hypothetical protein AB0953_29850 [Streptomyces sp. NPDC046866]|uniref:hypothetical protein n=1 Tax=Streptomyces sp. NPDC046866 TaxID=3154921 RepID=UPI0034525248
MNPFMGLAEKFYQSEALWLAVAALGGLMVGFLSAFVAHRVGFPKMRLQYGMPRITPLLSAPSGVRPDLELRHRVEDDKWEALTHPQIVDVCLVSRGAKDIDTETYDNEEPITLDVGALIVRHLDDHTSDDAIPAPPWNLNGKKILVGPGLIKKRGTVTYTLLVDGPKPTLKCQARLKNVETRRLKPRSDALRGTLWGLGGALITAALGLFGLLAQR